MKSVLKILFLLLFFQLGNAQTYRFKTTAYSTCAVNKQGKWSNWTKPKPVQIFINLDRDKNRFVVYSEVIQVYNIYKYDDAIDSSKEKKNVYYCVDNEGVETVITVITPKDKKGRRQIYITNDVRMIEYDILYLGDK